ncbi:MAG: MBL fold metallo-hydrolase [Lachnospiraceae bacterium]|nr:MBL fold metallo-hydrolase [Lachnospiraceae bacterium]
MKQIYENLYQFSIYIPPMNFTIHQYLLASDPAILFAAGTARQAKEILPQIQNILGGRELKYIVISHMESDEAGGIFVFRKAYPNVIVICGSLAARELPGWGYEGTIEIKSGKDELDDGELSLSFADYPSEVHDQDGIVCFEKKSGIVYSADLFLRYGDGVGKTRKTAWKDEVNAISADRIVNNEKREMLKDALMAWKPSFVAVGHGFCLECE